MRWSLLLGMLLCIGTAWAQERCFCLRDVHDNWLTGCEKRPYGIGQQAVPFCDDAVTGIKERVERLQGWTHVAAGQDGCTPCEAPKPHGPSGPRGDAATKGQDNASTSGTQPASK